MKKLLERLNVRFWLLVERLALSIARAAAGLASRYLPESEIVHFPPIVTGPAYPQGMAFLLPREWMPEEIAEFERLYSRRLAGRWLEDAAERGHGGDSENSP
jgi:hypothetical protein